MVADADVDGVGAGFVELQDAIAGGWCPVAAGDTGCGEARPVTDEALRQGYLVAVRDVRDAPRNRLSKRYGTSARQIMGVGEARNRTRRAVERTVPFGLICFSVVTLWYALHGHAPDDVASHRTRARWYTTKTEPSYDDMTIKLRRVIIAARFRDPCPEQATPQETRAVLAAWAAAGT